jgi:hypothetical protein
VVCVKKSLLSRVLKDDLQPLSQQAGSLMMVVSNDPLPLMNSLNKSTRKFQGLTIHESILNNKVLNLKSFQDLSRYGDRNGILSATLSYFKMPGFQLINILEQIKDKKSAE